MSCHFLSVDGQINIPGGNISHTSHISQAFQTMCSVIKTITVALVSPNELLPVEINASSYIK